MYPMNNDNKPVGVTAMEQFSNGKKRVTRKIANYTSLIIGAFLIIVVIFVFTTDIDFHSAVEWAELGLTFCVLLFCSYSMYLTFADSGTKAGKLSEAYVNSEKTHTELKSKIINSEKQVRLMEFCQFYVAEELKNVRKRILINASISYDDYIKNYVGQDEKKLKADGNLSEKQIAAIIKANKVKAIHLTPEKILKQGRGDVHRNPLGVSPESKKLAHYFIKAVTAFLTSALTGVVMLDIIANPTWATVAECFLKVLPIVLNGFMGYKMGFENIAVDTVNYMNDQSDIMQQFLQYVEKYPTPREEYTTEPKAVKEEPKEEKEIIKATA